MLVLKFSVDSALLRELGERLVGRPHIALAELVKNAYDADANNVKIRIGDDLIEVADDGHGMTEQEFKDFWMRIGSPHKIRQSVSRNLKRPLTGSKGVGRLAGQFLAHDLEIHTVGESQPEREFVGNVDWDEASKAGDLTEAKVHCVSRPRRDLYPGNSKHGTRIILRRLKQGWGTDDVAALAKEIWVLQPPFRPNPRLETDRQKAFHVDFETSDRVARQRFETLMGAITRLHYAQIVGQLERRREDGTAELQLSIEWDDGQIVRQKYEVKNCAVESISFEIRIYHLIHRQRMGIPVEDAREYLNEYGGVHIYDAGFRLPYYGYAHDWLGVEMAHAHRLSRADLLPEELQVSGGMEYLPTKSRMLGVVNLDTGFERERASHSGKYSENECLQIQITRDRLVENSAYRSVYEIVRWAVEFYATREKLRVFEEKRLTDQSEPARDKFERVEQLIQAVKDQLDSKTYQELQKNIREAVMAVDDETEERLSQSNLLGTLATAGISALALQHELNKQFRQLEAHVEDLGQLDVRETGAKAKLTQIASGLAEWLDMAKSLRTLFLNVADRDNRDRRAPLRARAVVESVTRQTALLLRGIPVHYEEVDPQLRLPFGAFAEWSAILQNVFLNAANAMLESTKREINVSSRLTGKTGSLLVQDTGIGVDLESADELFTPFVRKLKLSRDREEMGYGGMGLGLTIVRMLAANLGCKVAFVDPAPEFTTAFRLSWDRAHNGAAQPEIEGSHSPKLE